MKKVLSFAMALAMCLSLAACGGNSKQNQTNQSNPGSASQPGSGGASSSGQPASADSDLEYIKNKGTLVIGMTDFAPMDYKAEGSDEWIGFDADMERTCPSVIDAASKVPSIRTFPSETHSNSILTVPLLGR